MGGHTGFRALLDTAHQSGIAILVDVCAGSAGSQSDLYDQAMSWLADFHCDGLGIEGVDRISLIGSDRAGELEAGTTLLQQINDTVAQRFPNRLVIAHSHLNLDRLTDPVHAKGLGFGARTDRKYCQQINDVLAPGQESGRNLDLVMDSLYRRSSDDAFKRLIPFEAQPDDDLADITRFKMGAALALTTAGIPSLTTTPGFLQKIVVAPDEQTPVHAVDCAPETVMRKLMQLRLNQEGKTLGLCGSHTRVVHKNDDGKVIAWIRWYENERRDGVLVLVNFSPASWRDYTIGLPSDSNWTLQAYIGGTPEAAASLQFSDEDHFPEPASLAFNLEPYSVLILSRVP